MTATLYRPGTTVEVTDQPGPVSAPTDTDAWFVTGATTWGPTGKATLVRSIDEFEAVYGARLPSSLLWDGVETFLREGGSRAYVSRVAAADATVASHTFQDTAGTPADLLSVQAASGGVWGNTLSVSMGVVAGGPAFTITVSQGGQVVQQSPSLADVNAAVVWGSSSPWVDVTAIGTGAPATATATLAGGTDGTLTEAVWTAALDAFPANLGPGQVSPVGRTTPAAHQAVLAHCEANNRVAFLDTADTADADSLATGAAGDRTGGWGDHYGGLFASWAVIAGLAAGTERQVPWSPIEAGIVARNEHTGVSAAQPGAGQQYGRSRTALRLTQAYSDADRNKLTLAGVNTARGDLGLVEGYGFRTLVDAVQQPQWRELGQVRLIMAIVARAEAIAEAHLFAVLDGRRHEIAKFGGELVAMLIPFYEEGSLYGATPQEAFRVDVGAAVNTEATIANGELRAVLGLRPSHMAELVYVQIVKVETTQAL